MKLQHLFSIFPGIPENAFSHIEVTDICYDARKITPGAVFVAMRGSKADGHEFLADAAKGGAAALVVEDRANIPESFKGFVLQVPNSRQVLDIGAIVSDQHIQRVPVAAAPPLAPQAHGIIAGQSIDIIVALNPDLLLDTLQSALKPQPSQERTKIDMQLVELGIRKT
ncbi:MAG: hypothetical protein EOP06_23600, partial [Proteobacteria bacterium]